MLINRIRILSCILMLGFTGNCLANNYALDDDNFKQESKKLYQMQVKKIDTKKVLTKQQILSNSKQRQEQVKGYNNKNG